MTPELVKPPRKLICDFCNGPDVRWAYPTRDFIHEGAGSHGGWAACDACYRLIESGDPDALSRRVAKFSRQHRVPYKLLLSEQRKLHTEFWRNRKGNPVPTTPDNVFDPTREDIWGEMMRAEGQAIAIETTNTQPDTDKTISADAFDEVTVQVAGWMATRIMRKWHATDRMPKKVRLEVRVVLDDEGQDSSRAISFVLPDARISGDRHAA